MVEYLRSIEMPLYLGKNILAFGIIKLLRAFYVKRLLKASQMIRDTQNSLHLT